MTQNTSSRSWVLPQEASETLNVHVLRPDTVTDFSLFLRVEGEFALFAGPNYRWSDGEIARLLKEGHAVLYYHTTDQQKANTYQKISQLRVIDASLPPEQRIVALTDVGAELTKILYDQVLSPASLAKGEEVAHMMVNCMLEDNTCVAALGNLAKHDWYTYYHSARVSAYSLAIAIEMGLTKIEDLQQLAIGCLFHDVGKSKIDLNILHKISPLTTGEWSAMQMHPEFGIQVVEHTKFGIIPREVILHHHERMDGGGYPHKLSVRELLQEVRIASFADTYDALTTNRPYQPSRSRFEALDLIRHQFLQQLDPECYKAMVMILERAAKA